MLCDYKNKQKKLSAKPVMIKSSTGSISKHFCDDECSRDRVRLMQSTKDANERQQQQQKQGAARNAAA